MMRPRMGQVVGRGLVVGIAVSALAGCAVVPTVEYHRLSERVSHDTWVPFRLTDSAIVLGAPVSKSDFDNDDSKAGDFAPPLSLSDTKVDCFAEGCGAVVALAAPVSFQGEVLAIAPKSRRLISTSLSPVYVPNSLRLKVLTIEAKDHRLEAINTVGALVVGAAKAGSGRSGGGDPAASEGYSAPAKPKPLASLHLPVVIDLASAKCQASEDAGCTPSIIADPADVLPASAARIAPGNPGWTYTLAFLDNPRADGFTPREAVSRVHVSMVSSTCRPLLLRLRWGAGGVPDVVLRVQVADPDWLATVPFPTKGALVFHSLCGVDVQPQSVTEVGADTLANAFFNNVEQVRGAQTH